MPDEAISDSEKRYAVIVAALLGLPGVTQLPPRGFARGGLKIDGKLFACAPSRGGLLLKLPRHRVEWLSDSGAAARFDPGHGRAMKEWVVVKAGSAIDWLDLAQEALEYVRAAPAKVTRSNPRPRGKARPAAR